MYEPIHETISVVGLYKNAQFVPRKFLWRQREYLISDINLIANIRDGAVYKRQYAVTAPGGAYRLVFDRAEETWSLEEIWCD
ncbi:MAG: hypothetical protein COU66_00155 [Candidatus Pacebacteria bacterium CG10_big_fil_rev_8_21_14_0_10_44_11]|nr:MAG: hypothetical protein COU66_00155 [Candidatus Pacebacteria bacterium CG10_big_fil_rev_8_21_14_0_10_44_11]